MSGLQVSTGSGSHGKEAGSDAPSGQQGSSDWLGKRVWPRDVKPSGLAI